MGGHLVKGKFVEGALCRNCKKLVPVGRGVWCSDECWREKYEKRIDSQKA